MLEMFEETRRWIVLAVVATVSPGCAGEPPPLPETGSRPAGDTLKTPAPAWGPSAIVLADRACAADGECTASLTQCSRCEGACTGVRVDRAARYQSLVDCTNYTDMLCHYDCRPEYEIEQPRCVNGRCESLRRNPP